MHKNAYKVESLQAFLYYKYKVIVMSSFISVKAYDGTIVRIPRDKLNEFNARQEKIRSMLNSGKSSEDIRRFIKEGVL